LNVTDDAIMLAANTIRVLAAEAVQKANSGHPGMPMGAADYAATLWLRHLRYDPADPQWPNRDRFVLSAGHGSMLLYSLLHLAGYDLPMAELQQFRQYGSKTPGHPEHGETPGIETTTGPLGQGCGNAVGMALAAKLLAARFNRPGFELIDHRVFAIVSDGDLMEGVASEAASLAGHLKLDNLVYVYDDNQITIEGKTALAFSEDVGRRFEAYGWFVQWIDGHNLAEIERAYQAADAEAERPSLIVARTHIAHGAPHLHDSAKSHGEALGQEEVDATKAALGWPADQQFYVPDEVRELFAARRAELAQAHAAWNELFARYPQEFPEEAALWDAMHGPVPPDLTEQLLAAVDLKDDATRNHSGVVLQTAAALLPGLIGGSADLAPSTKTLIKDAGDIEAGSFGARNLHFGIREHAMASMLNGMALYGGLIPYGATFLIFSDYMRPSIRLAALMGIRVIYVLTHDSIFVGEDGPTHEPVEHYAALRAIPNLAVIRPADGPETAVAWAVALQRQTGPTALLLTRQTLKTVNADEPFRALGLQRGAYILQDCEGAPDLVLVATGSEVGLAVQAAASLGAQGRRVRVVSLPCWELFDAQPPEYREQVIPPGARRVAIESGVSQGWCKYIGTEGLMIGVERFGASAPSKVLAEKYGLTAEQVIARIEGWLTGPG